MKPKPSDGICVAGLAASAWGLWLLSPAVAGIIGGVVLIAFGVFLGRRGM